MLLRPHEYRQSLKNPDLFASSKQPFQELPGSTAGNPRTSKVATVLNHMPTLLGLKARMMDTLEVWGSAASGCHDLDVFQALVTEGAWECWRKTTRHKDEASTNPRVRKVM